MIRPDPSEFPTYFPCCGSIIVLRIEIYDTAFLIFVNDIQLSKFEHRIPPPVDEIKYIFIDDGVSERAELLSMYVDYWCEYKRDSLQRMSDYLF